MAPDSKATDQSHTVASTAADATASPALPYETPAALRAALGAKFAAIAKADPRYTVAELHRQFAYDRLLARLFHAAPEEWVLKGAGALLARLETGRHTKDIDLYWKGRSRRLDEAEEALRAAARADLGDFFAFTAGPRENLAAGPGGSARVPFRALLGPKEYARFHVDLVTGVTMTGAPDPVPPLTPIAIDGLVRPGYRAYPLPDHVADKLCAIIEPHHRRTGVVEVSTRHKDLVDLAVIAASQRLDAAAVRKAIMSESARRGLDLPTAFDVPHHDTWAAGYNARASEAPQLAALQSFAAGLSRVKRLLDPVLAGQVIAGEWNPHTGRWQRSSTSADV